MIKTYTHHHITWLDVEAPTAEDANTLVKAYRLHPIIGEEFLAPSKQPRAALYKDYIYVTLSFPVRTRVDDHHVVVEKQLDFVIGKDFIITSHHEIIQPMHALARAFESNSILDRDHGTDHAGHIFYYMMQRLYNHTQNDLGAIKRELVASEADIFSGQEKSSVEILSNLSRELLDFHQTSRSHLEILQTLEKLSADFFDKTFEPHIAGIKSQFVRVHDTISNNRELATELRVTNNSQLTIKQNETVKVLTVVATVTFSLSLFLELFSTNAVNTPIVGQPYDFQILLGIMVVAGIGMILYFKRRNWL
jgi:magnesium transporter